ncbi:hypothetical protein JAK49_06130 [Stenotrophomonas maltophilia]|uniref:hypothetical protein n=1 Tax=Stenotrophomonas maltophilia TaxID=40324 RepID=UPI000D493EEB|nr:hypothetical protein [Stenotrophomonas maltophilia]MCF3495714.1 hypothetical protein [Stenotrophomonas maltophilia]MCU1153538.1 hypothetical protein [Stenotrophomonas maltophilia]MCU1213051.1 hypothetical protein [Stenotrophomonas maltophilia]MCU1215933.1 hypothetical protein [Stenotrophomonas maltophilia]PSD20198.1 hypothetical protein C7E15_07010 [Stenotrophomonas maltophilia]
MSHIIFINNNVRQIAIVAETITSVSLESSGVTVHLIGGNSFNFRTHGSAGPNLYKFILDEMASAGASSGGTHKTT